MSFHKKVGLREMFGKRIYFENYGCPSNKFDLEVMITYLEQSGHIVVKDPRFADIFVINTCGVKKPTEDKILSRLRFLKQLGKPIVVTGCLPKINSQAIEQSVQQKSTLLDPFSIDKISKAVEGIISGKQNQYFFSSQTKIKIVMPKRRSGVSEIVPIAEGCRGSCSFCCTRFARGRLFSYPLKAIVNRIKDLVDDGTKEIWLTAQDTGAYGLDQRCNLATLLEEICKIRGEFFIRVGMMNPDNALEILDELVGAYHNDKVFKFLHLPVQSGNDNVLKYMNRLYSTNDFRRIVDSFRKSLPDISLSTDVICGFPGESDEAFQDTLKMIKEVEPDVVNISKFFPRPKTVAATRKQLPSQTVKARSREMSALCKVVSRKRNRGWLNWTGQILLNEKGKQSSIVGRNFAYKPIVLSECTTSLGKQVKVVVKETFTTYLAGEPL